ncbi:phosphoserine phosphatase [Vibrio rumoiensis]|uniref:Phosphoserine phosphatase n=1 Tax=Vibrio rumoiensis 1S-45 TaxID=1188252 RepID=A0A1E5E2S7_9VIBR|nr:phosphoserine phosphatase [Vibrio rumoiensis]OEF25858.1 phosphoserine phosphatase SerB [Vibrio rumoiensis 1S-45]
MDVTKTLKIQKNMSLIKRLPESHLYSSLDKQKAQWIVFGDYLSIDDFNRIDLFTGRFNPVLDSWKVGSYEVALMGGELIPEMIEFIHNLGLDCASISVLPELAKPGLIVMDMDSTAIQIECIDEIAKLAGVGELVSGITERAMQGELDFEASLRERVAALKGADESILAQVRESLPLMPDLPELVNTLKALGWKTAIASGGFTYFSDHLKETLGLDFAQSNTLEIVDGKLTGKVLGDIVSAETKADILVTLADEYDVEQHNTVAVGDGANDLVMMETAGLGVAYHAKPKVEQQAKTAIRFSGLGGVLCILSAALVQQKRISWKAIP